MSWDESYQAASGLSFNFKHQRPAITSSSLIHLDICFMRTLTHVALQVEPNTDPPSPPESLPASHRSTIKHLLTYLRGEAGKAVNADKSMSTHEGLTYVIQALQVRLNQHWHAVNAGLELSLEDLMGVLTMEDDEVAERQMGLLMESLSVKDGSVGERHGTGEGDQGEDPLATSGVLEAPSDKQSVVPQL